MTLLYREKFYSKSISDSIKRDGKYNGNTYGKTSKRGASKNTIVIKEYLEKICNELIKDMNLGKLTNNQRINLVKAILPYLLPKKKEVENLNQFLFLSSKVNYQ